MQLFLSFLRYLYLKSKIAIIIAAIIATPSKLNQIIILFDFKEPSGASPGGAIIIEMNFYGNSK
jgi:hypothetical protein